MLSKQNLEQLKSIKSEIRNSKELNKATVQGTRWRYGFARLKDGSDILIPHEEMLKVYPGDEVEINVVLHEESKRPYARIEKLFKSHLNTFVGKVSYRNQHCFLDADVHGLQQTLFVPPPFRKKTQNGDYVFAQIIQHPYKEGKAQAKVLEVLDNQQQPLVLSYILKKYQLPALQDFSEQQAQVHLQYTNALATTTRKDLTGIPFVTIDNASSTDLDDAVFAQKTTTGWQLLVAIADPCELITDNSAIEKQARNMTTSIYLPGKTLAMLPEFISADLASLLPQQKRLALVCEIHLDEQGAIVDTQLSEAIICSHAKLDYSSVSAFLDNTSSSEPDTNTQQFSAQLTALHQLSSLLKKKQAQRSTQNNKNIYTLSVDANYKLNSVAVLSKSSAHNLVEACMISCNESVALWMAKKSLHPALFNTQPGFRKTQLTLIKQLLQSRAPEYTDTDLAHLDAFIALQQHAKNTHCPSNAPANESSLLSILNTLLERSQFSLERKPHFSLGLMQYASFSSPIRRYQDFLLHRVLKAALNGQPTATLRERHIEQLNDNIQRNRQATQQLEDWLICQHLEENIGSTYRACIAQMQGKSISVYLEDYGISGNLDMRLFKKFKFNGSKMSFSDETHRLILGQSIEVKLMKIDWQQFTPVFSWLELCNDTQQ